MALLVELQYNDVTHTVLIFRNKLFRSSGQLQIASKESFDSSSGFFHHITQPWPLGPRGKRLVEFAELFDGEIDMFEEK
jgi:hypothetical protein